MPSLATRDLQKFVSCPRVFSEALFSLSDADDVTPIWPIEVFMRNGKPIVFSPNHEALSGAIDELSDNSPFRICHAASREGYKLNIKHMVECLCPFTGGVFLGTAMMHFLSDASSIFQSLTSKDYPFACMLACAGYLLTMLGDCIIQYMFVKDWARRNKVDVEMGIPKGPGAGGNTEDAVSLCDDGAIRQENKNVVAASLIEKTSFGDTLLLILALCFHSVFEGIAIGVSENAADAWKALWTISLHKVVAAVGMGIALLRMIPDRPLFLSSIYSFAFGISSPVGVAIGIIVDATTEGHIADWIYAIAMGIACGVFIYVAINHLFAKGYTPECKLRVDTPFYKFLAVVLGVGIIAVVMIWD